MSLPTSPHLAHLKALLEQLESATGAAKTSGRLAVDVSALPQAEASELSIDGITPCIAVSPSTSEQVVAILRLAVEHDLVVVPAGGMTKQGIGSAPEKIDILLRTGQLQHIDYDPAKATLTAGAGVTIAQLQHTLAATPHFLPLDPTLAERATVGGVLATNAHGPLSSGYGGVRDLCLDLEFVTAEGKIVRAAPYLNGLMVGSFGTLGVITSAVFRLFPKPAQTRTFVSEFGTLEEAIQFRDQILASCIRPMCLEIASPRAQEYLREAKPARDPDIYAPLAPVGAVPWKVFARAGDEEADVDRCRTLFKDSAHDELTDAPEQALWRGISDWEAAIAARHRNATIFHVSVGIGHVRAALAAAEQTGVEHNLLSAAIGRIGQGALLVAFLPLGVDPVSAMQCAVATSAFRGRLPEDASAVVVRCPREAKGYFNAWGSTPTDLETMSAVRKTFDPKNILNRGRFMV